MMGHQPRREALFHYFNLEDEVPADHLLRLIDRHVDFSFVRDRFGGPGAGAPDRLSVWHY